MALLVHLLLTSAVVEIQVLFSNVSIWMLVTKSLPLPLSWQMYHFGCSSSSSHHSALIHSAFHNPSILSSTTSSTHVLWIQFVRIAFASDSVLASTIPCSIHLVLNGFSHLYGTFSVFTPEDLATINWVTSDTIGGVALAFSHCQKLVSSFSSGTSTILIFRGSLPCLLSMLLLVGVSCARLLCPGVFTEASVLFKDLDFGNLVVVSISKGNFAVAIFILRGAASSEDELSFCSPAPSSQTVMMGVNMVVDFSISAFTCNELLVDHLAGCVAGMLATLAGPVRFLLSFWSDSKVTGILKCVVVTMTSRRWMCTRWN